VEFCPLSGGGSVFGFVVATLVLVRGRCGCARGIGLTTRQALVNSMAPRIFSSSPVSAITETGDSMLLSRRYFFVAIATVLAVATIS
jgi:hypothetical protein